MVLIIDNYDSFVENLARYTRELGFTTNVYRNDKITLQDVATLAPTHIIISPGPCTPNEAGISIDLIKTFGKDIPILGVCLGHQAIGQAFGAKVVKAKVPMHGKSSFINHDEKGIFNGIENPLKVARYHSLIIERTNGIDISSKELIITATSSENEIMAVQHVKYPVFGVQFHPESILTNSGYQLLKNFFNYS